MAFGGILAVLGVVGLRKKLRRYEIAENSMEPQLSAGDYVIAKALAEAPLRGGIVIVPHPEVPHFDLAKRIIGLPGETVTLHDGQVHIDGAVLAEPWADGPVRPDGEWTLLDQQVFVLGDNLLACQPLRTPGYSCFWPMKTTSMASPTWPSFSM